MIKRAYRIACGEQSRTMKILKKTRRIVRKRWLFLLPFVIAFALLVVYIVKDLPSPTRLSSSSLPQSSHIYDRHGTLLYTIYSQKNQTFVPLKDIPKHLQQATIAIEDKDFYRHGAVDFRGIARAMYVIFSTDQLQGGSTLTQQLVKTSLLSLDRTIERKIREVILAFATEMIYSKDQIIEMYLNQVPYGGTAYGVEAASRTYFGKGVKDLTLSQSAFLAALPEAPSTFSPFGSHPELGKRRHAEVLAKMQEQGYITQKQKEQALKESLSFQEIQNPIKAPHFVFYVKDLLEKKYGASTVEQGGLRVITSLDLPTHEFAQLAVASEVAKLKSYRVGNGGAVITNPSTGEMLAMVGSKDYFNTEEDGNVNVTISSLQPGSSIKPINYAVGLIKGLTAATPFVDQAICFPNPGQAPYCPKNYDGKFRGIIQFRHALANSINIPAVKILKYNGLEAMIATASAMGISSFKEPDRYGLSLTLGGGEVTMLEMATAYGTLANLGYRVDLHPILKITGKNGKVLEEYTPPASPIFGKRVLPSAVSFIISHILLDNNARSQAFGTNSELRINDEKRNPLPVSVKTGTTNDFRDNWTIGYTPSYLVAVWVGNNDHTPMGSIVSGVTGAAPIWNTLMSHVLNGTRPEFPKKPVNVVGMNVCSNTGLLPTNNPEGGCPTRFEYFIKGNEPKKGNVSRQKVFIDKATQQIAKPGQTENVEEKEELVITDALGDKYCASCPQPTPSPTP